jgi:hypothetical protein
MAFQVEISDHTADALVVDILRTNLTCIRNDIERLTSKAKLMEFESEDLKESQDLEQALIKVIRYYTTPDKWESI